MRSPFHWHLNTPLLSSQTCTRLMPNESIQSWQNVKMYWFNRHESVYLEYTNQFNHVTKCIWIHSIKSKEWLKWFQSISELIVLYADLFGKPSFTLTFFRKTFHFIDLFWYVWNQFNWFKHTSPSKWIDSVTYFMKTFWLSHQSNHFKKELNQFSQFCGKN